MEIFIDVDDAREKKKSSIIESSTLEKEQKTKEPLDN